MLLRALSSWVLTVCRDEASTTSLAILYSTRLMRRMFFFLTANLNLLCSMAIASQPLAMLCCKEAASACSVTPTKALEAAARSPIKPSESQFPSMQALQHTLGAMVLFYEMQFCVSKL